MAVNPRTKHVDRCLCDDCTDDHVLIQGGTDPAYVRQYQANLMADPIDFDDLAKFLKTLEPAKPKPALLRIADRHPDLAWLVWAPVEELDTYFQWLPSFRKFHPSVGESEWSLIFGLLA